MAEKQPGSISIVWEETENRPTIAITGAYGGASPDGSTVIAHVYTEYGTVPSLEEVHVQENGSVNLDDANRIRRGDVTRRVTASLVMAPEACVRLGIFLQQQGRLAIDHRAKNPLP